MIHKTLKIKKITSDIINSMNSLQYKNQYVDWLLSNKDSYIQDNSLRKSIIENVNTPLGILLEFYQNYNYTFEYLKEVLDTRISVIDDLDLLRELVIDLDDLITLAIIKNDNIDKEIVEIIVKANKKIWIDELINYNRFSLDEMININENSLYGLKDKAYDYLLKHVSEISSATKLEKLMHYTSKDLNYFIAQNKYLTPELFSLLAYSNDFRTRSILAKRSDTPIEVLYLFIDDESDSVRLALAENINADKLILSSLAKDDKLTIIKKVIVNPNTDKGVLLSILNEESSVNDVKVLAKEQLSNLENLDVESNLEYSNILEDLKLGKIKEIEILKNLTDETERKTVLVELSDDF